MSDNPLIAIAVITGPHGIKGEVKLKTLGDSLDIFTLHDRFWTHEATTSYQITLRAIQDGKAIARLQGMTTRNEAESLKGTKLYLYRDQLPEIEEQDTFYQADLIGLEAKLENGDRYGRVAALYDFGAGDIIEIELPNQKREMISFNKNTILEIDLKAGYLIIQPPEMV